MLEPFIGCEVMYRLGAHGVFEGIIVGVQNPTKVNLNVEGPDGPLFIKGAQFRSEECPTSHVCWPLNTKTPPAEPELPTTDELTVDVPTPPEVQGPPATEDEPTG